MDTLKIIEGQGEDFEKEFSSLELDPELRGITSQFFNWHKQSIKQILEAEVERLNTIRESPPPYSATIEQPLRHAYQNEGYMKAIDDQITHLTNIINKL
jgi:hypothetical protein